jgi:hypothetical protein
MGSGRPETHLNSRERLTDSQPDFSENIVLGHFLFEQVEAATHLSIARKMLKCVFSIP